MIQTEPAPHIPAVQEPLSPEELNQARQHITEALGSSAIAGSMEDHINPDYIQGGIQDIDAYLAQHAPASTPEGTDDRTYDAASIAADHEEASAMNDAFDIEKAHAEALEMNKQFDIDKAYEEALEMDREFEKQKAAKAETPEGKPVQKRGDAEADPAQQHADNTAETAEETSTAAALRSETNRVLEEAGINTLSLGSAEVTTDAQGHVFVMNGTDAKMVIPSKVGGKPTIKEYSYDKASGTLTIGERPFKATAASKQYEETNLQDWQTYEDVDEVPAHIARRFGIERNLIALK